jgi:hypothetical protein
MKYCPNCGAPCEDGEKFCHQCGTRLENQTFTSGAGSPFEPHGRTGQSSGNFGQPAGNAGDDGSRWETVNYGNGDSGNGGSGNAGQDAGGPPENGGWRHPEIKRRNVALCILFSIITCGIYQFYWIAKMNDESKELVGRPEETSGGMVVLFSIITCGIYELYWLYRMGERVDEMKNRPNGNSGLLFLILPLAGAAVSTVFYWITNENYSGTGLGIMIMVVLGIIQEALNKASGG